LIEQDAPLSQRDRAAGCVIVLAKSRRLELYTCKTFLNCYLRNQLLWSR